MQARGRPRGTLARLQKGMLTTKAGHEQGMVVVTLDKVLPLALQARLAFINIHHEREPDGPLENSGYGIVNVSVLAAYGILLKDQRLGRNEDIQDLRCDLDVAL